MSSTRPSIAILGAGIAGLALAIGLLKQDIPFTLYEAASQFSVVGAGVGLGPNAVRAMDLIDKRLSALYDGIKTGNRGSDKMNSVFDAALLEEGFGVKSGWQGATVESEFYTRTSAHRKALLDVMVSLIPLSAVHFNKRAVFTHQSPSSTQVAITFSDGETIMVDAVIGCDGIKGATRKAVLGELQPSMVEPVYAGLYVYRGILPIEVIEEAIPEYAGNAVMFMDKGRNMTLYPISHGKEMNFIAVKQDLKPWEQGSWTEEVARQVMEQDFDGIDRKLAGLMELIQPVKWAVFHHPETSTYYNKHICLVGDSAHATTPFQAAGGGQALESVMLMSHLLGLVRSPSDIETAFEIFDEIRRLYTQKVIVSSLESGIMYCLSHEDTGTDMKKVVEMANERLPWIWRHDLDEDLRQATVRFEEEMTRIK